MASQIEFGSNIIRALREALPRNPDRLAPSSPPRLALILTLSYQLQPIYIFIAGGEGTEASAMHVLSLCLAG